MQYLVDKYDPEHKVSYPHGSKEYYEVNNWVRPRIYKNTLDPYLLTTVQTQLFWQMGGLGPMQGQANHFTRYAPEKIEYGMKRYQNETRRLYRVMDTTLAKSKSGFLVGDRVTVADMSCWGWVASASKSRASCPAPSLTPQPFRARADRWISLHKNGLASTSTSSLA